MTALCWGLEIWGGGTDILPCDLVAHSLCHKRRKEMDLWMQIQGYQCLGSGSLEAELEIGLQILLIYLRRDL